MHRVLINRSTYAEYRKNASNFKLHKLGYNILFNTLCLKNATALTRTNRFRQFLTQMLLSKYPIKKRFIFPPQLTSASALPGKTLKALH